MAGGQLVQHLLWERKAHREKRKVKVTVLRWGEGRRSEKRPTCLKLYLGGGQVVNASKKVGLDISEKAFSKNLG